MTYGISLPSSDHEIPSSIIGSNQKVIAAIRGFLYIITIYITQPSPVQKPDIRYINNPLLSMWKNLHATCIILPANLSAKPELHCDYHRR